MITASDILGAGNKKEIQGKGTHESVPGPVNEQFWGQP